MTRVMVIGNAGGGKSSLCRAICAWHGLPYVELDRLQWQPGWVRTPDAEFEAQHEHILARERWLIDGYGPEASVQQRLDACDTVILVDHPFHIHLWWATKRQIRSVFFGRPDGSDGCPMWRVTFRLYRMMRWLHRHGRPRLMQMIANHADHIRVIHITSPTELKNFMRNPV